MAEKLNKTESKITKNKKQIEGDNINNTDNNIKKSIIKSKSAFLSQIEFSSSSADNENNNEIKSNSINNKNISHSSTSTSEENKPIIPLIKQVIESSNKDTKRIKIEETISDSSSLEIINKKKNIKETSSSNKDNIKKKESINTSISSSDSSNENEWVEKTNKSKSDFKEKIMNEENKIVVKNIPQEVTEIEIEEMFSQFGTISDIRMPPPFEKNPSNKHRGVCFIVYKSSTSISKAMKINTIKNKPIEVVKAERNYKLKRNTNSVFVGNLPYDTKQEEMKKFFSSLKVETGDIRIPRNQEGRGKGFAFMEITSGMEKLLKTKFIFKERHLKINSVDSNNKEEGDRGSRNDSEKKWKTDKRQDSRSDKRQDSRPDKRRDTKSQKIVFDDSSSIN